MVNVKTFKEFIKESTVTLEDAVRAYTCIGGQYEDKYEYKDSTMYDIIAKNIKSRTSKTL